MQKITHYIIITGPPNETEENVQYAIENGWQPWGSPSTIINQNRKIRTTQAMVKYEETTENKEDEPKKTFRHEGKDIEYRIKLLNKKKEENNDRSNNKP